MAAKSYNAGPANRNPTAGEGYTARAVELVAHYHALAGAGGPGTPPVAVVQDGYGLPFDPAGLHAVTTNEATARPGVAARQAAPLGSGRHRHLPARRHAPVRPPGRSRRVGG
ncbi:MAG TPA: hypothetical protein VM324_01230 [Egibacteraceae bacterium]|nr:hypothetical protein [Egibacteraceae bacterium]